MTTSVTIRAATQDELERCGVADKANLIDGSFAILRDGGLIGLTDEYGTIVYTGLSLPADAIGSLGTEAMERIVEVLGEIWL